MQAYIIIDGGYPTLVGGLELVLNEMFRHMEVSATAKWYYDEFVEDGTEYGVRLDANGMSRSDWTGLLLAIEDYCVKQYGHQVWVEVS